LSGFRVSSSLFYFWEDPISFMFPICYLWSLLHLVLTQTSQSNDKEFLDTEHQIAVQAAITCVNTWEFFTPIKLKEVGGQFVDPNIGVRYVLVTMRATLCLFKSLTDFTLTEFEKLAQLVVPTIFVHARSIKEPHHISEWLAKLTPNECLFNFILYIKHNNVSKYDAFLWNWSKIAMNDDGIFITSCINSTIVDEIRWPIIEECWVFATQLP